MADPVIEAFLGGGAVSEDAGLNAFRETVRSNDYFRQAAAPLLTTRINTSMMDPWTAFGTTAAQAFLGSALNTLGKNREADQLIKAATILPQLQGGDVNSILATQAPEGIDPEAFGALKLGAIKEMFQRKQQIDQYLGIRGMFRNAEGELTRDPGMKKIAIEDAAIEAQTERAKALMKVVGEQQALDLLGVDPKTSPDTPQGKELKRIKDIESDYYKRITDLPQYKLLADVDSNFKALVDLSKQDSKAADIGLISTVARIRDPNSTVREGEFQINADTQSYLDKVLGNWRATVTGDSRLTKADKVKIIASVVPKYNELGASYLEARNPLLDALMSQGGNKANIPTMEFNPFDLNPLYEQAPEAIPTGMKLQKNPTTGALRLVPR